MKILLSAYACEPNKGSEPAVGWNWAVELAKLGHETWVVTRANNQKSIELVETSDNLHFIYYDLPKWASWWKNGGRGVYLYYLLWQWGAYLAVKKTHKNEKFELVHHVTFVSVRQPSFMGELGIPFIFGPVGGGESAPWKLRKGFGLVGKVEDSIRDFLNALIRFDPMMRRTFKKAYKIYVTSEQTKALVPASYQEKIQLQLAIAIASNSADIPVKITINEEFRILYVGNYLHWKGMHLGIKAFSQLLKKIPNAKLTLIGKGPYERCWKKLAKKLGVSGRIEWLPWVEKSELKEQYLNHDVFLFPSLHDSGGMVVLEAMSLGLPVLSLDIGGPGVIVTDLCGYKIATTDRTENDVVNALASALLNYSKGKGKKNNLSEGAIRRAGEMSWSLLVSSVYRQFNRVIS